MAADTARRLSPSAGSMASILNDRMLAGALTGKATVVGVLDTDVAGLKRMSARSAQRQRDQFAFEGIHLSPNRQVADRAVVCFIYTNLNNLVEDLPFERLAIGYAFGDAEESWLPIDAGSLPRSLSPLRDRAGSEHGCPWCPLDSAHVAPIPSSAKPRL